MKISHYYVGLATRNVYRVAIYVTFGMLFFAGTACLTAKSELPALQKEGVTPLTKIEDDELITLVRTFSEDVGENGQEAWLKLRSYPRKDLISALLRLLNTPNTARPIQTSIAFALCNMDYEYQKNVQIIASGLREKNENADQSAALLGRLTSRGDTALLRVLFDAARWSDSSLATALGEVFSEQLRDHPETFLALLNTKPRNTRLKVYMLIRSGSLTASEVQTMRERLSSIPRTAQIWLAARGYSDPKH